MKIITEKRIKDGNGKKEEKGQILCKLKSKKPKIKFEKVKKKGIVRL